MTDPIDTTAFEQQPCSVLTAAQQEELSISAEPEPRAGDVGPACQWGDLFDNGISVDAAFVTKKKSSIAGLYRNNQLGRYAYFEPVTVLGYPAAFSDLADGRGNGGCGIAIGLRNELILSISLHLNNDYPGYSEPCSVLKKVSEMAVKTMTKGGS